MSRKEIIEMDITLKQNAGKSVKNGMINYRRLDTVKYCEW